MSTDGEPTLIYQSVLKSISMKESHALTAPKVGSWRNVWSAYKLKNQILFTHFAEKTRLPAGTHRYPFQYQLMTMIPTSLEEKYGHIRYVASVRFNDFWDVAPIHEETFTIIKPKNLNLMPDLHVSRIGCKSFRCDHIKILNFEKIYRNHFQLSSKSSWNTAAFFHVLSWVASK